MQESDFQTLLYDFASPIKFHDSISEEWKRIFPSEPWIEKLSYKSESKIQPSYLELAPLFIRIKNRLGANAILKMVSDEDPAIIGGVTRLLPKTALSFCVFHQLQNLTKLYLNDFKNLEKLPDWDKVVYGRGMCE